MTDFNKIYIVKPTPKWLCTKMHGECAYCKYDAPHPSATPSDWSSKDWDGKKAKAREQCPFLNFNLLERQIQKTLQDRVQDVPQDMTHDNTKDRQETDLTKGIRDLTLKEDADAQNSTDAPAQLPDMPEEKGKVENEVSDSLAKPMYEMTKQEIQLQEEEKKYGIYMSTFVYKGDDSNLDSGTETESDTNAYPYLG